MSRPSTKSISIFFIKNNHFRLFRIQNLFQFYLFLLYKIERLFLQTPDCTPSHTKHQRVSKMSANQNIRDQRAQFLANLLGEPVPETSKPQDREELIAVPPPPPPAEEEPETCPVCLEEYIDGSDVRWLAEGGVVKSTLTCGHDLCRICRERVLATSHQTNILGKQAVKCPICREVDKPSYAELEGWVVNTQRELHTLRAIGGGSRVAARRAEYANTALVNAADEERAARNRQALADAAAERQIGRTAAMRRAEEHESAIIRAEMELEQQRRRRQEQAAAERAQQVERETRAAREASWRDPPAERAQQVERRGRGRELADWNPPADRVIRIAPEHHPRHTQEAIARAAPIAVDPMAEIVGQAPNQRVRCRGRNCTTRTTCRCSAQGCILPACTGCGRRCQAHERR